MVVPYENFTDAAHSSPAAFSLLTGLAEIGQVTSVQKDFDSFY